MQLLFPWFLLGLTAVAIPVVVHLLQLRRPQRVLFTNTAFIREAELITVRHRQVQRWLVLLARVLAIVALVLVFCQPFIPAERDNLAQQRGTDVWVDNTNSMQVRGLAGRNLLDEAVTYAGALGKGKKTSGLRLLNSTSKETGYAEYVDKLNGLKLGKINAGNLLMGGNSSLYLFSDFQKNSFSINSLNKLAYRNQVVLVPLKGKPSGNIYIDSVWLDDAFVRVRTNLGLHIRVRNGGQAEVTDCPVKVFLGAKQAVAYRVSVAPGQSVTTVAQVQVDNAALVEGRVVVDDAPVTFDNVYYFTLHPAAAIRVLEIGDEPLAQQVFANEPLFAYTFAKSGSVNYGALRQANLILLSEVRDIDAGLREALRGALGRGASVVVVPSAANGGHASYDLLFKSLGLGTVQWEAQSAGPELREVAMPSSEMPFFRDVFGAQQRAVTMPRVAPVLRWSRTGTDIMRLRDGESFLAGFASGTGDVYVFSAPFAAAYSDFTEHALFVPVMYRMAMLSYRNEQLPAYRLDQGAVTLKLPASDSDGAAARSDEAAFRLVKDSLLLVPGQRVAGAEVRLELPRTMSEPGFYQVRRGQKVLTTLAFNPNKRESELAAYSADDLRQMLGNTHPNVRVVESGTDGAGLAADAAAQTGTPLWRYFLAAALVCLLAEALLVRFGRRRVAAVPAGAPTRAVA
ncbi:BatA domain-containing protein [Hymenobacter properus]|uniref:BatA domain-containing protein n=1 Tax=Hymenobacter properus TaxID=2791026 RepID=A0A931BMJ8_9BACT|nr:BatA domain-containing protein [Hymenobacter properus]MBF9144187.1 BatA domain-containing protein [Hymenobacter properus]MBR7723005.1 BatA domain-containing protein [Microvirga sp. SRT04]